MTVPTFQIASCLITSKANSLVFGNHFEIMDLHKLVETDGMKVPITTNCSYATNLSSRKVSRRTNSKKPCQNGSLLRMNQNFIPRTTMNRLLRVLPPWFRSRHHL